MESEKYITQSSAELGLSWKVSVSDALVDRPRIHSAAATREHTIFSPEGGRFHEADALHELTHAFLAERLDPIFASVYLDPTQEQDPDFQQKSLWMYHSQQCMDVWIEDAMHRRDPELMASDTKEILSQMLELPFAALEGIVPLELFLNYAYCSAYIERYQVKQLRKLRDQVKSRIRGMYGKQGLQLAQDLASLFVSMPVLSEEKEYALQQFQEQTQKTARLIGFPIIPELRYVDTEQRWVWHM